MRRTPLFWLLFPSFALITIGGLLAAAFYGRHALRAFYREQVAASLEARADFFADRVAELLAANATAELDALAKRLGQRAATRITVVLPTGEVVADSHEDPAAMDNHRSRPEVAAAWNASGPTLDVRYSDTVKQELMYLAIPLHADGQPLAVVRTAMPIAVVDRTLARVQQRSLLGALFAAALVLAASWGIGRRISRPLEAMTAGAERFARGELDHRLDVDGFREVALLAEAMNRMASQLRERIETVVRQRNQQDAMMASMIEGVLAVDNDGKILNLNRAAGDALHLDAATARGRLVHEVLRIPDLLRFVDATLADPQARSADVAIRGATDRFLHAHGTALSDADGRRIGVLIVFHDVTRLRHLENVRRHFVANVSHELQTPITSIKGFAETLLDGALDDHENAERFVRTILKQADRLIALIADIFTLSRIEKDSEEHRVDLQRGSLREVLESAARMCEHLAAEKSVDVVLDCPAELEARINARLLEQAVMNLIDNAIKYSPAGSTVTLRAERTGEQVVVAVVDRGCGIEAKHLPRVFERFYRVDTSRSRELGGTGLGLAIVKHIALTHGGSVDAESRVGAGSTFRIRLPAR